LELRVSKSKSSLGTLLDRFTTLAFLAALGWVAWYAHSNWVPAPTSVSESVQGPAFNCRKALAQLAADYDCRNSDSCTMSHDELSELTSREADIERYCN
jgi:hypothetical protein